MYSSALSLTLPLDGVGGQRHVPADLSLLNRPGTYCTRGSIGSGPIWISPPQGFDPWTLSRSESLYLLRYPGPLYRVGRYMKLRLGWLCISVFISTFRASCRRIVRWTGNGSGMKWLSPHFRYYPRLCMEGLKYTMENLKQDSRFLFEVWTSVLPNTKNLLAVFY
jgi:hypothetical protein